MRLVNACCCLCSGERATGSTPMEEGRIGERPEVIYHVFHTLLFGALAMLFQGYLHITIIIIIIIVYMTMHCV